MYVLHFQVLVNFRCSQFDYKEQPSQLVLKKMVDLFRRIIGWQKVLNTRDPVFKNKQMPYTDVGLMGVDWGGEFVVRPF